MQQAAEMALFDAAGPAFELVPRDTGGTPDGAGRAASAAIAEGAQLLIGPLFGDEVPPVRTVALSANLQVVAFTNDVAMAGGNVWLLSNPPEGQVDRIVEYASQQGLSRFAVLAPDNPYGRAVVTAARQATVAQGASLERVETYAPGQDASPAVQAMAAPGPFGGVPYDALLLPESGLGLQSVAPLISYYGIEGVQLLGTGLWEDPAIGRDPSLAGAWFAAPDPNLRYDFEQRYRAQFGTLPPRLATLAYDAVALAAALARQPAGTAYDAAAISDPGGFSGIDGIFRFRPDGTIERGLAVLEVTPTGPIVRAPAPLSFAGPSL
jgi:hypothetical protein